jgi:hypothetical protein
MPRLSKTKHVNSTGSRGASCDEEVTEVPRLVGSAPEGLMKIQERAGAEGFILDEVGVINSL